MPLAVVGLIALGVLSGTLVLVLVLVLVYAAAALPGVGESVFLVAAQAFPSTAFPAERMTTPNGRLHAVHVVRRDSLGQPPGSDWVRRKAGMLALTAISVGF
ncbi:hypothetical protein [Streptomyces sp. NPDC020362]|uniref:hypothetical protein n=1 Tax=unclassified Streptomyces TaxID=2593676 RepID=UPI000AE19D74